MSNSVHSLSKSYIDDTVSLFKTVERSRWANRSQVTLLFTYKSIDSRYKSHDREFPASLKSRLQVYDVQIRIFASQLTADDDVFTPAVERERSACDHTLGRTGLTRVGVASSV